MEVRIDITESGVTMTRQPAASTAVEASAAIAAGPAPGSDHLDAPAALDGGPPSAALLAAVAAAGGLVPASGIAQAESGTTNAGPAPSDR